MSQLLNGSICIEDLFTGKVAKGSNGKHYVCIDDLKEPPFNVGKTNGKHYVNVTTWINEEPDQFQNHGSFSLSQSREQREAGAKKQYIGNLKYAQQPQPGFAQQQAAKAAPPVENSTEPVDDLPF